MGGEKPSKNLVRPFSLSENVFPPLRPPPAASPPSGGLCPQDKGDIPIPTRSLRGPQPLGEDVAEGIYHLPAPWDAGGNGNKALAFSCQWQGSLPAGARG